jgi:hypothetical protein
MSLEIRAALVCDDVRREDNGKLILIGVYGKDIGVTDLPANLVLSLVVRFEASEAIDEDLEFRYCLGEESKASQRGHLSLGEPGFYLLNVANAPIMNIAKEDILHFQWKRANADWQTVYSIPIVHRPSITVPPPS